MVKHLFSYLHNHILGHTVVYVLIFDKMIFTLTFAQMKFSPKIKVFLLFLGVDKRFISISRRRIICKLEDTQKRIIYQDEDQLLARVSFINEQTFLCAKLPLQITLSVRACQVWLSWGRASIAPGITCFKYTCSA